ncbi:putative GINS complex subunit Sld5, GINS subunit, domain A protein [Lupinus albus]|uniref:Putative GINS complex subunit Sld5, GINS subunit, domain A protein n=1 Tax=Lupinus albus TaxID=3870 RepID=A0A6A4NPN7_LUPAL|nr:putative GINS complex subunit Sld5, GINS subunit, domain A protein [Lupinus albus]
MILNWFLGFFIYLEETVEENSTDDADPLSLSLYQMDLDRTLFLLRSYLRVRIQKIEKYMFHIRKTEELWNRLSKEEKKFTRGKDYLLQFSFVPSKNLCTDDQKKHVEENVLS